MKRDFFTLGSHQMIDNVTSACVTTTIAKPFFGQLTFYDIHRVVNSTITTSVWGQLPQDFIWQDFIKILIILNCTLSKFCPSPCIQGSTHRSARVVGAVPMILMLRTNSHRVVRGSLLVSIPWIRDYQFVLKDYLRVQHPRQWLVR